MIAPLKVRDDLGWPPVARSCRREETGLARLLENVGQQRVQKRGNRHRRAGDVEAAVRLHSVLADHVEIQIGDRVLRDLRMFRQIGNRAEILRNPHQMNRLARTRELARSDQSLQRSGDLDHRRRSAGIVVGAPLRVIEVTGDDHFLAGRFRSADPRVDQRELARAERRIDPAPHPHEAFGHQRLDLRVLIRGNLK